MAAADTLKKSLVAITEANDHSTRNLEAMIASATAAAKGMESLRSQAVAYSQASFRGQVAAARSLSAARSLFEVIELQTTFAATTLEAHLAAMRGISETVAASAKSSLEPLHERITTVVGGLKASS